ncbi:hypothetical protein CAI21_14475 [Alkalilimnicola ehrlichii]|uniref:Hydrolase n=1 Tax=Alkalilimnicola ehrlichii TaxID=351052 RepID=A0A3E0WQC3_9GAMM|nr:metal-dependent hydrolase [Alkalilimnicola ehrlichii]RFA27251.1 hypothetical protein CAI21_14475 [Alkalilimnicola ehrlichii]RFA34361.1 hypothetical protein CAL65_15040 [Alkalilimnicola ehrlichii]
MDTLTHIAFGATLGGLMLRRQAGWKAFAYGAALANLPDIDAVMHGETVGYLLIHRGITHSLFFQALAVPIIVALILALHRDQRPHWLRWSLFAWLAMATHSLMDAMNPYGAQLLAPFSDQAISFNLLYVVDPIFTIPLLLGLWAAWRWRPKRAQTMLAAGLLVSMTYLTFAATAKWHVQGVVEAELARQNKPVDAVLVMPMPFTTLLWRALAVDEQAYYEGYYSLVDGSAEVSFSRNDNQPDLLEPLMDHLPVQQLKRFAQGFYHVEVAGEKIVIRDLRLGQGSYYPVSFVVGQVQADMIEPVPDRRFHEPLPSGELSWLWQRIWREQPPA